MSTPDGINLSSASLTESGASSLPESAVWVDTLVDCPGTQDVFTYRIPSELTVRPGDILSVPFGTQQVGAIAIRCSDTPPAGLQPDQVRDVEAVINAGFFPPTYWSLLNRVAEYYCTPLMQVIRVALPPGLLARSQRRVRLINHPPTVSRSQAVERNPASATFSTAAQQLLELLHSSKMGNFSWQYLQRQVNGAYRGLQELLKAGMVENYLEPPTPVRPKLRRTVTLVVADLPADLSSRQQEILSHLQRQGGEMWLTDVLQQCRTSSATLKTLVNKGYLVMQDREVLRLEAGIAQMPDQPKLLTSDQSAALEQIQQLSGFNQVLLHGVTGSGKTEVYLQAIAPILQQGRSALVLVPEIGLTPQLTDRFRARFGNQVGVYHSALSEGERYDTWRQMLSGKASVVIGTRSAVFAPVMNLGMIVLDEEHDSSFKQDQPAPCYHARTVAQWRTELDQCPLILGSATPSLESWVASRGWGDQPIGSDGKSPDSHPNPPVASSLYLSLPNRIHARPLPGVEVVDMRQELHRGNHSIFSRSLQSALQTMKERGQQGILFIHRRGHSTFVSCRSCGYIMTCPNCDVALAYHHVHADAQPLLRCHYCNHSQSTPKTCPSCDSLYFKYFGSGTQRVIQELARHCPDLRVLRFDSDTTQTKGSHRALLTQFAEAKADVLVGTQMLTKGIDLPQVTLVGIVAADGLLYLSDYRASERAFQTLTQVAGRCGRGDDPGRVILQTYTPENSVIQAVQRAEYGAFIATELDQRVSLNYPPYGRLILLRLSSLSAIAVQIAAEHMAQTLAPLQAEGVHILGPAPATILRIARRYRWQILLKLPRDRTVTIPDLVSLRALCPGTVSLSLDIDPITIL
jgi:primosomal protein N' (replication factor Y)